MALSNWDTLAIGTDGKTCAGSAQFEHLGLEVYKNWVYINSDELWKEGLGYGKPVIAQFIEGEFNMAGVTIIAKRGPQQAIFIHAYDGGQWKQVDKDGILEWTQVESAKYFCAIGCYGFADLTEDYVKSKGITLPAPYEDLLWFSAIRDGKDYIGYLYKSEETLIEVDKDIELNPWTGVTAETLEQFKSWLKEVAEEEYFNRIGWDDLLRFNQGDMYITDRIGGKLPGSMIGEQQDPILIQALKTLRDPDESEDKIDPEPLKPQ